MNRDLDRDQLDAVARRELQLALQAGPWCWPVDEASEQWRHAMALVPTGPPALPVGSIPLVTVHRSGSTASLWVLRLGRTLGASTQLASFEADAVEAWDDAATALPRSLPFLWSPVKEARDSARRVELLATVPFDAQAAGRPRELRGRSFGLAFVLVMASKILGVPVADDLAASATVDASGEVGPVEDIERKIAAIEQEAPRIRTLLVAAGDQAEHAKAVATHVEIVPVGKAAQAVDRVFGSALRGFLQKAGSDPRSCRELVDSFFRLTLHGRGAAIDWSPVERGAAVALQSWPELSANDRWRLEFSRAVASRHETNRGAMPVPTNEQLDILPVSLRISVITHLVQHCADTGTPTPETADELAVSLLVPISEAFTPHMKLWGARARLLAVTGRPQQALAIQRDLARALVERLEYEEVSYQLSEWYRLAGALCDGEAFEGAQRLHEDVTHRGGLGFMGDQYVDLAHARAAVALGMRDEGARRALESLASNRRVPSHLRWSAVRWLARLLHETGEAAEREFVLRPLVEAAEAEAAPHRTARTRLALAQIDVALRRRNQADAWEALSHLAEFDPGPVGHLVAAAQRRTQDECEYIARFYPY